MFVQYSRNAGAQIPYAFYCVVHVYIRTASAEAQCQDRHGLFLSLAAFFYASALLPKTFYLTATASLTMSNLEASQLFSAKGLVAVITGASSGLGEIMAHALDINGAAKVFILGRRKSRLHEVASKAV
jgi:hypothetical protein